MSKTDKRVLASRLNKVGERHVTKEGYWLTIAEYFGWYNCTIKFDNGDTLYSKEYGHIVKGNIKNPFIKTSYGVGYLGEGENKVSIDGKLTKPYYVWYDMIRRCYNPNRRKKDYPYIGCEVHESWLNFQTFAEWFKKNYTESYELDKDILVKGNKIYSPETCRFVPHEINSLLIKCDSSRGDLPVGVRRMGSKFQARLNKKGEGLIHLGTFDTPELAFQAYKEAKENQIKRTAISYFTKRKITKEIFRALINYQVEITD